MILKELISKGLIFKGDNLEKNKFLIRRKLLVVLVSKIQYNKGIVRHLLYMAVSFYKRRNVIEQRDEKCNHCNR